jgi:hypothetical protein
MEKADIHRQDLEEFRKHVVDLWAALYRQASLTCTASHEVA